MTTYNPKDCDRKCNGFKYDCPQYERLEDGKEICNIAYIRIKNLYSEYYKNDETSFSKLEKLITERD